MIFNNNKIYGKVWKVDRPENGKYMDLQISTSEKDINGGYKNSSWFPRVIGHALNSLKDLKVGDKIVITSSKFTNERKDDGNGNKKSWFKFLILEATIDGGNNSNPPQPKPEEPASKPQEDELPW